MTAPTPEFSVTSERGEDARTRVIRARGELDSGSSEALVEAFRQAIEAGESDRLVLDLGEVSFIDSAGMRAMILLEQTAGERGVSLAVTPPPAEVTELLRLAGLAERINLRPAATGELVDSRFSERIELELPADSGSPSRARAEVREALAGKIGDDELWNLVLLTSELVTNAVLHPQGPHDGPIGLRIIRYEAGIRVEVEDPGDGFDPAQPIVTAPDRGRGLFLVDSCAARWGTDRPETPRGERFRVWFEVPFDSGQERTAASP